MNYRTLGHTGLKVSELCLGTMTFGENFFNIAVVDQRGASKMVARAIESGINFFDTADVYAYGQSETLLGRAIKDSAVGRETVIIATKVRGAMSEAAMNGSGDVNNVGLSRQHIRSSVEQSLRRLGTDYIDLYQVHGWDVITPIEAALRALDDLVRQGKVRYLGCSNWSARHLGKRSILRAVRAGPASSRCRLTTHWSDVISSTSCCRCAVRKVSACCRGRRFLADSSRASIGGTIRIPQERGAPASTSRLLTRRADRAAEPGAPETSGEQEQRRGNLWSGRRSLIENINQHLKMKH